VDRRPQKTLRQLREEFNAIELTLEMLRDDELAARMMVRAEFGGGKRPSNSQLAAVAKAERRLADAHRRIEQICNETAKIEER
jgi:hypothetical protein